MIDIYKRTDHDTKMSAYILSKLTPDIQQISTEELIADGSLLSEIAKVSIAKEDYNVALDLQLKAFDIFKNNNSLLLKNSCDDIAITYRNVDMVKHQEYVVLCGNIDEDRNDEL